jgi:hypothetical protein
MNRVITEAGSPADLAIWRIGRPSLAIAFRRASEGAVLQTIEAFLRSPPARCRGATSDYRSRWHCAKELSSLDHTGRSSRPKAVAMRAAVVRLIPRCLGSSAGIMNLSITDGATSAILPMA